ncbi:hypothetical protein EKO04_000042 [Ascochyta lentis]|uniref:pectin lyase n=1 Tax=Ascochyta lentis TaxID=205686 RepID=A0A8H7JBG0_9PLEO|nr:hypothetical protein EKO04_000042 [Ascochyta lentis]
MRFEVAVLIAAAASASAQAVVGKAYGFASGVTGGGQAAAVTPTTADELAKYLSDDTERVILITKEFDFTGKTATGSGCDRKSCSASSNGQFYLGELSCAASDDNVPVSSIKYDTAGPEPLKVGSNKSILGVGGKGVLKGKGLSLAKNAKNVIIQGLEFTNINPGVVWGGDALDFQGGNDGVWVDHNKFSLVGRMFIVSHYSASRLTVSNNEFDGVTTTSASCNDNHYWTMMFYGDGDKVTLDRNYYHDVSGRAPKLGQDGTTGTFHAINNYFENMKGHAFDAYNGAQALIEGNVFSGVEQPATDKAAKISTFVVDGGSACSSALGRACLANSVDAASGKLAGGSTTSFISALKGNDVTPLAVKDVAAHVKANAGPANLGAASSGTAEKEVSAPKSTKAAATTKAPAPATTTKAAAATTKAAVKTTLATVKKPAATKEATSGGAAVAAWGQCGGQGYTGSSTCASGLTCKKQNDWYSQCL